MTNAPAYFEAVRGRAAKRTDQLEQDPVLAGPWHQLFKQIPSRLWHVISHDKMPGFALHKETHP